MILLIVILLILVWLFGIGVIWRIAYDTSDHMVVDAFGPRKATSLLDWLEYNCLWDAVGILWPICLILVIPGIICYGGFWLGVRGWKPDYKGKQS